MNPLSEKLEAIASVGAISSLEDLQVIREAAAEIAIASNTVQAATMLALTTAEKFAEYQRRNDELLAANVRLEARARSAEEALNPKEKTHD